METKNRSLVAIGGVVTVVLGFNGLLATGIFSVFDGIISYEYSVTQWIWLSMIIVGLAVIVDSTLALATSPKDFLKKALAKTSQFIQVTGDMSEKDAGQFLKDIASDVMKKVPVKVNAVTVRQAGSSGAPAVIRVHAFPSPAEIARALWNNFAVFRIRARVNAASAEDLGPRLSVLPTRPASGASVESLTQHAQRQNRWILAISAIALCAAAIAWVWSLLYGG